MKSLILLGSVLLCFVSCTSSDKEEKKTARSAPELVAVVKRLQHPDTLKNGNNYREYTLALEEYVDNYPDHEQYKGLLWQAAKNAGDRKDLNKSAHYYARYAEQFPDEETGAQATFAAGFIYNNELKQLDSAKKYYALFVANYPTHFLKTSAESELEHLGKSPDQMLKDIQKQNNEQIKENPAEVPSSIKEQERKELKNVN